MKGFFPGLSLRWRDCRQQRAPGHARRRVGAGEPRDQLEGPVAPGVVALVVVAGPQNCGPIWLKRYPRILALRSAVAGGVELRPRRHRDRHGAVGQAGRPMAQAARMFFIRLPGDSPACGHHNEQRRGFIEQAAAAKQWEQDRRRRSVRRSPFGATGGEPPPSPGQALSIVTPIRADVLTRICPCEVAFDRCPPALSATGRRQSPNADLTGLPPTRQRRDCTVRCRLSGRGFARPYLQPEILRCAAPGTPDLSTKARIYHFIIARYSSPARPCWVRAGWMRRRPQ